LTRIALVWMMAALCLPRLAAAQVPSSTQDPDTVALGGRRPKLTYVGEIKGNVSQVSMANRVSATALLGNDFISVTRLGRSESEGRIEERSVTNGSFLSTLSYTPLPTAMLNGSLMDTRSFNRLITSTGVIQSFINNTQKADASGTYARLLGRGLSVDGNGLVSVGRSEQTFENNQSEEGAGGLGLNYRPGAAFNATVRGYIRGLSQESESGGRKFSGLGGSEDSVLARAQIITRDSSMVKAEYMRFTSTQDYLDIPRTSQGGLAISDTVQVIPEEESRDNKSLSISAEARPLPGVLLTIRADHTDAATYFIKARERIGRDTGDFVLGDVRYRPTTKSTFVFNFENREIYHWLGPERTGHYDDKNKKLGLLWDQFLIRNFKFTAQAGASLSQTFYTDPDQDGDRDERYIYANVKLLSEPLPKIKASVYVNVARTDFIRVRSSQSANNRQETVLQLSPEFTYAINRRVTLDQKYGLNIQFADYVFQENENFLDRTLSFSNILRTRLSGNLGVDLHYSLQLHDRGSYLRPEPDAERVLVVNQEERRDEVKVAFRYQINRHLALTGANDYSQRKDLLSAQSSRGVIKNGGVEVGIDGKYDFGNQRTLKLALKRVKRFGRFNAPEQNDYWAIDSSINYTF
jgi:hypothetical protein